jgi:ABC-type multidrug transport system fused ATPase/permease subunit
MSKFIPASLSKIYTTSTNIITCFCQPCHFHPFFNSYVILSHPETGAPNWGIYPNHQVRLVMARDKTDLINLKNVGVRRDNRWLVRGIDLRIREGEIVTIIGPNGAGKSTTAKLAVGTIRSTERLPNWSSVARFTG